VIAYDHIHHGTEIHYVLLCTIKNVIFINVFDRSQKKIDVPSLLGLQMNKATYELARAQCTRHSIIKQVAREQEIMIDC